MAYTSVEQVNTDLDLLKWQSEYWQEYVRESGFNPYMGKSVNSIIQTQRDLLDGGMDLIVPLVASLKGRGTGAGLLTGNEEAVDYFSFRSRPYWRRNAVVVKKSQQQKAAIDILRANKDVLKLWSTDDLRDRLVDALSTVDEQDTHYNEDTGVGRQVLYSEATATQLNNWNSDNQNRILYGVTEANYTAGNHATSLGNVDAAADTWSSTMLDAAKTMARRRNRATGVRAIRPYRNGNDGKEYYVLFVGTRSMNKLRADADIKAANKDARPREDGGFDKNPIFQGGDLMWNGIIIHEIPEMPTLTGAGAAGADVEPGYLCGAQALLIGWGQDPATTMRKDDDYGFIKGVGVEELRSVDKTFFKSTTSVGPGQQHGVATIFACV
jgi:N4-gp56 family major capsid protein